MFIFQIEIVLAVQTVISVTELVHSLLTLQTPDLFLNSD